MSGQSRDHWSRTNHLVKEKWSAGHCPLCLTLLLYLSSGKVTKRRKGLSKSMNGSVGMAELSMLFIFCNISGKIGEGDGHRKRIELDMK